DDEAQRRLGARLHGEEHRPDVGVIPRADILDIENQSVEPFEILGARLEASGRAPVEGNAGESRRSVNGVSDRLHVDRPSIDSVLGAKEASELSATNARESSPGGDPSCSDARGIGDQPETLAADRGRVGDQSIDSGAHARHRRGILTQGKQKNTCKNDARVFPITRAVYPAQADA